MEYIHKNYVKHGKLQFYFKLRFVKLTTCDTNDTCSIIIRTYLKFDTIDILVLFVHIINRCVRLTIINNVFYIFYKFVYTREEIVFNPAIKFYPKPI